MGYYDYKKKVIGIIDNFVAASKFSIDDICFYVMKETGYSERFIRQYLEKLIDKKIAKETDGIISQI